MSNEPQVRVTTPVGRLVWGAPGRFSTTNKDGKPYGQTKDGSEKRQWALGVAFPKFGQDGQFNADLSELCQAMCGLAAPTGQTWDHLWAYMNEQNVRMYRGGGFSWKLKNGDLYDGEGQPGHFVLAASTFAAAPSCHKLAVNGGFESIEADEIKTGDFVALYLSLKLNAGGDNPGIYVNPEKVLLIQPGQPIFTGTSPDEAFGDRAFSLPPGAAVMQGATASAPPVGTPGAGVTAPIPPQGTPAAPAPAVAPNPASTAPAPAVAPIPPQGAPAAPAPAVAPNPAITQPPQGANVPSMPGGAPAAPAPGPRSLAERWIGKSDGITVENFAQYGWTEELLVAHGYAHAQ